MYPDQHIPYIRLSSNLKKGVYDAVLTYYIYDEEGASQIGTLSAGLEIIIQN